MLDEPHDAVVLTTTCVPEIQSVPSGRVQDILLDKLDLADETFRYRASLRIGPLKRSIEAEGQALPIMVRSVGETRAMRYQVISGFRRATAMTELGRETIGAIVRDDLADDGAARRVSVLENSQRKTYSDIDRALVIRGFLAAGSSKDDAATLLALTKRQVEKIEKLLNLPDEVQQAIDDPDMAFTATHGIVLQQLANKFGLDEDATVRLAEDVVMQELSVSAMRRKINKANKSRPAVLESIFRASDTNRQAGVYRLQPTRIVIESMSDDDKAAMREELEELLKALR